MTRTVPRSLMYVPANRPELFDKGANSDADAIIVDLEDAVAMAHKATARLDLSYWLDTRTASRTEVWVRATPELMAEDLRAAARPCVAGIVVAKCSVRSLRCADELLTALEAERGLSPLGIIGLIETADALRSLAEMSACSRLQTFGIGEVDLLADLRITRTPDNVAVIDSIHTEVVIGCAAAGLAAPIAPTATDFRDLDEFVTTTARFVNKGFRGRTALHPRQVPIINAALTPTADDIAGARRLLDQFEQSAGAPLVDDQGRFVDKAVVRGAREILDRAPFIDRP